MSCNIPLNQSCTVYSLVNCQFCFHPHYVICGLLTSLSIFRFLLVFKNGSFSQSCGTAASLHNSLRNCAAFFSEENIKKSSKTFLGGCLNVNKLLHPIAVSEFSERMRRVIYNIISNVVISAFSCNFYCRALFFLPHGSEYLGRGRFYVLSYFHLWNVNVCIFTRREQRNTFNKQPNFTNGNNVSSSSHLWYPSGL